MDSFELLCDTLRIFSVVSVLFMASVATASSMTLFASAGVIAAVSRKFSVGGGCLQLLFTVVLFFQF